MIDYPLLAKDRELSADEALEVLEAGEFCVVSTVDADGMPYGVPLSYVMLDGALCMKYLPEYKDKIGEGIAREIDDTAIWAVDLEEVRGKGARRLPR